MRIEKLEIKGFGKLLNISLGFDEGLNIVFGENETGKTTMQSFLIGMFFGLKGGREKKDNMPSLFKKYRPWSGNAYSGTIEYRLDNGAAYKVERSFDKGPVSIYDSAFNNITNSFDKSKKKGVEFAEKHLGVNETCFEKTVFIRQMESKLNDGSGELLNRLINVSQTGFEDVSFKKAQDILKDAIKNHTSTGKTSTRPLDKVNTRLDELKRVEKRLKEKRDSLYDIELKLKDAIDVASGLERAKLSLDRVRGLIEAEKTIYGNKKTKSDLNEILGHINDKEDELEKLSEYLSECESLKKQFACFSNYSSEDTDSITADYERLLNLVESDRRTKTDLEGKKEEKKKIELELKELKLFDGSDRNLENEVSKLKLDMDNLKLEYGKINIGQLDDLIKNMQRKITRINYLMITLTVLFVISVLVVSGLFDSFFRIPVYAGYFTAFATVAAVAAVAVATFVGGLVLAFVRAKTLKSIVNSASRKKTLFSDADNIGDEINKKQKLIDEIFKMAGVKSFEEIIRIRAAYDNKLQLYANLNSDVNRLDSEHTAGAQRIFVLKNSIVNRLSSVGIINPETAEIEDGQLNRFKQGIRKYHSTEQDVSHSMQRMDYLNRDMKMLYGKALSISKTLTEPEISDIPEAYSRTRETIGKILEELSIKIKEDEDSISDDIRKIKDGGESFFEKLINTIPDEAEKIWKYDYERICSELGLVLLDIKEYETLLKSMNEDDEIQRTDEQIAELSEKKRQLEDINFSLVTALDVLTNASLELQKDFVPLLNSKMSNIIKIISNGRYNDLRADKDLCLNTIAPETGDIIGVSSLSGGAADQAYLALRFAMADIITGMGEKLPFVMDEVFAQYDDLRTAEALRFLKELSVGRQIILFTCKKREVDIAREICGNRINIIDLEKKVYISKENKE